MMESEGGDGVFAELEEVPDGPIVNQGTQFTKKSLVDPLVGNRAPKGGEMVREFKYSLVI